jgi:signal transduction histidine kinase/CheY-like chemotaxis protein
VSDRATKTRLVVVEDVLALRHRGRVAAAAIGCDEADQVRFATALSELGREAVANGGGAAAEFTISPNGSLAVTIADFPRAAVDAASPTAIEAARKLVGDVTVTDGLGPDHVTVRLRRGAVGGKSITTDRLRSIFARSTAPSGPLEQLRQENADLVGTLDELRAQQEQLVRLNSELEETNRGVMAMYQQLADELDETNRGVVALYAELDDKSVRLSEASEAKNRFLNNVTHELRGPVNSLLALGRLLLAPDGDALTGDQRKQVDLMLASGRELSELVNELLDLAKAESGRLEPTVSSVDLAQLFAELRGASRPMLYPGVRLTVETNALPPVQTDRTLLTHVLRNLIVNAVKFTTEGSIHIGARRHEAYDVEIIVADTGIGIAPENHGRIFEDFFQVRGPLQTAHKGTGLGLPYAKRVVETLGGRISLQSELGRGSVFAVVLPTAWQPLLNAPASPTAVPHAAPAVDTVLLVDDDEAFRTVLRGMLQGTARHVIEASGGVEGLRLMRQAHPDLVFLDLHMPDLDGSTVLAEKSADLELQQIPVIIVTSMQTTLKSQTTLARATGLLAKANLTQDLVQQAVTEAFGASAVTK